MDGEKKKEGVSVKEMENFAKHHRFEIFYLLLFIFAGLFSLVFWGPAIGIFCGAIGAIVGVFLPDKINQLFHKLIEMVSKQEMMTQLIFAIVGLIVAIFVAPIIFLLLGLSGGKNLILQSKRI
ncbi:MAG: hypothetical protein L0207_04655 [Chlamydiae bacterium]|nr:hypothetical protein [Chlamydiota bacterium]